MLKNFWLCICLLLCTHPLAWAETIYQNERNLEFNEAETDVNEPAMVKEQEKPDVEETPSKTTVKAKGKNCVRNECEEVDITN